MEALYIVVAAVLGMLVGSFLNVCIDRLPRNESIVNPPSHCEACDHRLTIKDLVPLFSFLRLKGRCRYCQASIPQRLFWVELSTAIIFAFLYWSYGLSLEVGIMTFYACLFIVFSVVDLKHGLILNKVLYPGMVVALLIAILLPQPPWIPQLWVHGLLNFVLGGAIGFVVFLLLALISRGGIGFGDVKLAALIGLATGFPLVFLALILGAILGGIAAIILLATKKKGRKEAIPFGPFLAVAAMVTLLWGNSILNWYVGLM
ncbi:MAG: prepilin peptidase [Dehalococcoidia bacterium]|nr:MAG: prepilin peptidase [Dehalococcoidia bacterium]